MFKLWDVLMDEAGDASAGGGADPGTDLAVIDSGTDLSVDDAGGDDTAPALAVVDDQPGSETTPSRYVPVETNGRWSSRAVKDLAQVRTSSPGLWQQIQRDRTQAARLRAMTPAGKNPFEWIGSLVKTIKSLGEDQGIQGLQEKSATFDDMDAMFTAGDPEVLDKYLMWDAQGSSAIMKLLPHVVARVEKLEGGPAALVSLLPTIQALRARVAPKAAAREYAQQLQDTLMSFFVAHHLRMLVSLVDSNNESAKEAHAGIKKFLDAVTADTQLQPEVLPQAPVAKAPEKNDELDQQRQQLQKEQTNFRRQQWKTSSDTSRNRVTIKAWGELSKGKKIDPIIREDVQVSLGLRLGQAAKASNLDAQVEGFFQRNDIVGYQRFMDQFWNQNVPRIMKAELEKRVKRGPVTQPQQQARSGQSQQRQQAQEGMIKVAARPHPNEVDGSTTPEMYLKNQFIRKSDGKKCYFVPKPGE